MRKFIVVRACAFILTAVLPAQFGSTARAAPSTADFVTKAASGDMFEIRSSRYAAKTGDSDSKPFARTMVRDPPRTSSQLRRLISSGQVRATLPTSLDPKHRNELSKLRGLRGAEFDRA